MKMRFEYDKEVDLLYVYYVGRKYSYSESHKEDDNILIAKDKDDKVIALELMNFIEKGTGLDYVNVGLLKPLCKEDLLEIGSLLIKYPSTTDVFIVEYDVLERKYCFKSYDDTTLLSKADSIVAVLKDLKKNFWLPEELLNKMKED